MYFWFIHIYVYICTHLLLVGVEPFQPQINAKWHRSNYFRSNSTQTQLRSTGPSDILDLWTAAVRIKLRQVAARRCLFLWAILCCKTHRSKDAQVTATCQKPIIGIVMLWSDKVQRAMVNEKVP
jgi:hypothetical protein